MFAKDSGRLRQEPNVYRNRANQINGRLDSLRTCSYFSDKGCLFVSFIHLSLILWRKSQVFLYDVPNGWAKTNLGTSYRPQGFTASVVFS